MEILSLLFHVIILFSIDASGDPIMANDVITSSNHLVTPIWNEKTLIDVNVSQWSHEEKLIGKVVRIRMTRSIWDH